MPPSPLYDALLGDPEIADLVDDRALVASMIRVETSLAVVQGRLGVIPEDAAKAIARAASGLVIDPAELAAGLARDGVPVPALVKRLKDAVGPPHADSVHFGATSQDVVDTAFVLTAKAALDRLDDRLAGIVDACAGLAERHAGTLMAGRTRFQLATPTTFGLKAALWALPLHRHRCRLAELRPRLECVSLAGASGNLAALGSAGKAVEAALADDLGLGRQAGAWHSARDGIAELAGWLSMVTGSLGKIGADILLLARNEVGELAVGGAGGSSTMPFKANPVGAEILVALARRNADAVGSLHHALVHAGERDGSAWTVEWLAMPEMIVTAAAATRTAGALLDGLRVNTDAMRDRVIAPPALLHGEAAIFALSAVMARRDATAAVADAAKAAAADGSTLFEALEAALGPIIDWPALDRLDTVLEAAQSRTTEIVGVLQRGSRMPGVEGD